MKIPPPARSVTVTQTLYRPEDDTAARASATTAATPWTMPPLLRASAALHVGAAVAFAARPDLWPAWLGLLAADHALLTFAGLWPRCDWLGPNLTRLPAAAVARGEVALTIDDGPDPEVTPQVLDLLDAAGAKATFFCIAERARAHPELLREMLRRGHSVQNHSRHHRHTFSLLGPEGFRDEISQAQAIFTALTGQTPAFFRAPAGLRNPFLEPVLHRLGLRLASWTRRAYDTREGDPARVLATLTAGLAAGDILLLHDANAARGADGRPVILAVLPELLAAFDRAGLRAVTLPEAMKEGA